MSNNMQHENYMEINGKVVKLLPSNKKNRAYYTDRQQVFIIGSKGIPANYGGFETFVEKLIEYQQSDAIRYHVARTSKDNIRYEYNGAKCFNINTLEIGAAKAIYYDMFALKYCIDYCKARPAIKAPIFYVLACRIGPFIDHFKKEIDKLNGKLYVNPDGHEWMRGKWSTPVQRYWKISEKLMVKHADLLICDSKTIEQYIRKNYRQIYPHTTFIGYGADTMPSTLADDDPKFIQWLESKGLSPKEYYLVVGRFVPENNYETMICEFMRSRSEKKIAIVTGDSKKFMKALKKKVNFDKDIRIKFVGTMYDQELLKKIRENAYGYFHGHEVGGTNPSLLEALGSTALNLLLDVGFNREVALDSALYWTKAEGNLAGLINQADGMGAEEHKALGFKAKKRIADSYSWSYIVEQYEKILIE